MVSICPVHAYGQTAIATGYLRRERVFRGRMKPFDWFTDQDDFVK